MNGRVYDPLLARFLSPDPYVQAPDFTQSFNRYSYCINNPFKYTDPNGYWFGWDDLVVAGAGFIFGYVSHGITTGDWGWDAVKSGGLSAGSAWLGYNTCGISTAGSGITTATWNYIGSQAINTVASQIIPPMNVQFGDNFSLSVSPTFMLGSMGIGAGVNVSVNYHLNLGNGWYTNLGVSAGAMNFSTATGTKASNVSTTRVGYGLTAGRNKLSLGLYSMGFGSTDGTSQRVGGMSFQYDDFIARYENDGAPFNKIFGNAINDGGDKYRTAAVEIGYGDYRLRMNLYTGDSRSATLTEEVGTKKYKYGYYSGGNVDDYRLGALAFGYKDYYIGGNWEMFRHVFQNKFAHTYLSKQPGFKILDPKMRLYYSHMSYDKFSLW